MAQRFLCIFIVFFCAVCHFGLIWWTVLLSGAGRLVLKQKLLTFCSLNSTCELIVSFSRFTMAHNLHLLFFFLVHAIIWGALELSSASSNDGCNDSVAKLMYLLFVIYPGINHARCRRASDKWAVRKSMGVRCLKACIYHGVMITRHYCWAGLD